MPKPVKSYPAQLVGEKWFQDAVADSAVGDVVSVVAEIGNPRDDAALAVVDGADRRIGYLRRDSWLRAPLTGEGKGCTATIAELVDADLGFTMVKILVTITEDGPIGERAYQQA